MPRVSKPWGCIEARVNANPRDLPGRQRVAKLWHLVDRLLGAGLGQGEPMESEVDLPMWNAKNESRAVSEPLDGEARYNQETPLG
jgi:hypothetical protein